MKAQRKFISLLLLAALAFTGCAVRTADELYCLPKRSESYNDLQVVIDEAMVDMEYCAPISGENQQSVQMADLDGDGTREYLVFAKSTAEHPLKILIFDHLDEGYVHTDTIECNGTAFDVVHYVQMDQGGVELVVGVQLSDQVMRSVSVYTCLDGEMAHLVSSGYSKFLTVDLDADSRSELFILRPGNEGTDKGIAEVYCLRRGIMERTNEMNMSEPADRLKRIIVGKLYSGETAVYVASASGDTGLITDVYILKEDRLVNVSVSSETDTSIRTLRNYYVYADDIDNDSVVELPNLLTTQDAEENIFNQDEVIRWYALTADGQEVDRLYTYHDFAGGWYFELPQDLAPKITVIRRGTEYEFQIQNGESAQKVLTVYVLSSQNQPRDLQPDHFVIYEENDTVYVGCLHDGAEEYGITQQSVQDRFNLIRQDWNTGET